MSAFVNLLDPAYISSFDSRQRGPVDAIPTPLPTWSEACGDDGGGKGLARQWLVVIGGNPKFGKSLLALNMALTALRSGNSVGFMSLEMTDPQLAARFYAMASGVPIRGLEKGRYQPENLNVVFDSARAIAWGSGLPVDLIVNAEPIFELPALVETMHQLAEQGVRFFVVDYLQLVAMGDEEHATRITTMAMAELRKFVRTKNVTCVALSQFKRQTAETYDASPRVQGLMGGTMIEATADQIVLLDHSLYELDSRDRHLARSWISLTNRHGRHGDIPVLWNYKTLEVREGLPDEEKFWPHHERRRGKR